MFKITKLIALAFSIFTTAVLAGETQQMSQQELLEARKVANNNIVLLDVRSEEEYKHGHIAGAINISHNTIEDNLKQLAQYKSSNVVVYCRSGRRAGIAEHILAENDFNKVYHLTGDMNGWLDAKQPIITSEQKH
jgi:rhodanese-related sulfurtransferase